MWENTKERDACYWQIHVSADMDKRVQDYLNSPEGQKHRSRSNLVQSAVEKRLTTAAPVLKTKAAGDPLRLAADLASRKAEERAKTRRHVRWCIVLDRAVDKQLKSFLRSYGARHGARCRFVDDAVRDLIGHNHTTLVGL